MVMMAAQLLDEGTVLNKLPFITVDEAREILARRDAANANRFEQPEAPDEEAEV